MSETLRKIIARVEEGGKLNQSQLKRGLEKAIQDLARDEFELESAALDELAQLWEELDIRDINREALFIEDLFNISCELPEQSQTADGLFAVALALQTQWRERNQPPAICSDCAGMGRDYPGVEDQDIIGRLSDRINYN